MADPLSDISTVVSVALAVNAFVVVFHLLHAGRLVQITIRTSCYLWSLSGLLLGSALTQEVWLELTPPVGEGVDEIQVLASMFSMFRTFLIVFVANLVISLAAIALRSQWDSRTEKR